ncbi:putative DNA helicase ino80 [Conglomerata obtusa]
MQNPFFNNLIKEYGIKPKNHITSSSITTTHPKDTRITAYLNSLTPETDLFECDPSIFTQVLRIQKLLRSYATPTSDEKASKQFKDTYTTILKQIPKQLKYHKNFRTVAALNSKKIAIVSARELRRALSKTSKTNPLLKAKRISRELHAYYKKQERGTVVKKNVKSLNVQRKKELEEKENQRQKRKLAFLINQTELFGHFMRNKNKELINEEADNIDCKVKVDFETGDENTDLELAKKVAMNAAIKQKEKLEGFDFVDEKRKRIKTDLTSKDTKKEIIITQDTKNEIINLRTNTEETDFDSNTKDIGLKIDNYDKNYKTNKGNETDDIILHDEKTNVLNNNVNKLDLNQGEENQLIEKPTILNATLKGYQIQGLTWLVNLYDQGINGILADDMGLGKTVQSISFLAHLYEKEGIPGPFLIVTPASTLHNWIAEFKKFLPIFKVISYWGSVNERKIIRKGFSTANVIVTSYQMIVTDEKVFKRNKWHYMILDEAQAIKSSSSIRWKTLLAIACRNRLLLTGTPIQNTMAELWALLHFIMPTLFDSHDEFNAWFSKDIEKEGKKIDDIQLQRLHMILKPFMLRREKKDVKDELGSKTEKDIYCEMSKRQKKLYKTIEKQKFINIDDVIFAGDQLFNEENKKEQTNPNSKNNMVIDMKNDLNNKDDVQENLNTQDFFDNINFEYDECKQEEINNYNTKFNEPNLENIKNNKIDDALLNTVMQLRKVCNHPDLFQREEVTSGLCFEKNEHFTGDVIMRMSNCKLEYEIPKKVGDFITANKDRKNNACKWIFSKNSYDEYLYEALIDNKNPIDEDIQNTMNKVDVKNAFGCAGANADFVMGNMEVKNIHDTKKFKNNVIDTKKFKNNVIDTNINKKRKSVDTDDCKKGKYENDVYKINTNIKDDNMLAIKPQGIIKKIFVTSKKDFIKNNYSPLKDNFTQLSLFKSIEERIANRINEINDFSNIILKPVISSKPIITTNSVLLNNFLEKEKQSHDAFTVKIPRLGTFIIDSGKLTVLDALLTKLKIGGHRVLIYFQMTKMMDLMEDYLVKKGYTYCRLDGSSRLNARRDVVNNWQNTDEKFIFLLSTRAGGLGINLTAADTVIFYDSDWNPTMDQQAMDRAHRLGQTKDVVVYRLITTGTIEERVMEKAMRKGEIQKMVIQGGDFNFQDKL